MSIIRDLRKKAGISQRDLGQRMSPKLSLSQAQRIEAKPENAKLSQLQQIAKILNVPWRKLLEGIEDLGASAGLSIGTLHPTVPIFELSELGSRGRRMKDATATKEREYIAPTEPVPEDSLAVRIQGHANSDVLNENDVAIVIPWDEAKQEPGATVLVERTKTGEVVIGQYYPLHPTSPDAPGFNVVPHNRKFDTIYCTKRDPGVILGRLTERRQKL